MSRKMVKLIHADGFFPNKDAENLRNLAKDLTFIEKPYGFEIPDFNLIFPDSEIILNKVLGERVTVDPDRSGVIRRPINNTIHFEHFESTEEWCFVVALEPTTVNFWYHIDSNSSVGDAEPVVDAYTALDNTEFNYKNLFEWTIHSNILLNTNQCLFFRPWVFHSLSATFGMEGMVQYYRLLADTKFRILVMGMPGSSRATIAKKLAERMGDDASILRSFDLRHSNKDVDFSEDGQIRHCYRLLNLARASRSPITIIDMTCPLPKMRQILNTDIVVWACDNPNSPYDDLNRMYVPPFMYDIKCEDSSDTTIDSIINRILTKRL